VLQSEIFASLLTSPIESLESHGMKATLRWTKVFGDGKFGACIRTMNGQELIHTGDYSYVRNLVKRRYGISL